MEQITITGVPEHFNFPWIEVVKSQPFLKENIQLQWLDESKGSGAMNKALREGKTDIAIVLTESFIKDRIEGNSAKIIGFHVSSPLVWGIHSSSKSNIKSLKSLEKSPFLISRFGSGSHLMAYLLAKREGWKIDDSRFEVIGNLDGAIQAFQESTPRMFLWEKYTTKPLVDEGLFDRVGEIPTPWPCFVIVARQEVIDEKPQLLKSLLSKLYATSSTLKSSPQTVSLISQKYRVQEADILEWISQTDWQTDNQVKRKDLHHTMDVLKELGLIEAVVSEEFLVSKDFVQLI
ncbi:ABC transporter substrate-binding protein [Mongoliibacter ruber]|uniref:ABC-type nitrate/sulfonate/bicarbonate transport system substrate-binding protein n=1 Tax=Mongoliibacter ruber TaxID=1750599 RepID=A0A2T0WVM3_9BACT|nr:ABC transporter substrate-binding protein [Mongoliibacter ruber]PRY90751.1 ABC-type nitrate/sulfonate/bicarbonate transport system substrate-binding protein [Mongoliibacter ruber]